MKTLTEYRDIYKQIRSKLEAMPKQDALNTSSGVYFSFLGLLSLGKKHISLIYSCFCMSDTHLVSKEVAVNRTDKIL